MKRNEDLITLVIHTPDHAGILKDILETNGISAVLEDVVISDSSVRVAEKVRIHEKDLMAALKILESGDNFSSLSNISETRGGSGKLLLPVDFSDSSLMSVRMGFSLALRLSLHPVILHTCAVPMFPSAMTQTDSGLDSTEDMIELENEATAAVKSRKAAKLRLNEFAANIRRLQKEGILYDVKFSTILLEGVPEEAILDYCKTHIPELVVMATRGITRKEEELIGSVTAEVLDSVRVPILTVPEHHVFRDVKEFRNLMMFCNLDQHDLLTLDSLMRMFDYPECNITLVPVYDRRIKPKGDIESLCKVCKNNYPVANFDTYVPDKKDFRRSVDDYILSHKIDLLIVPNKKTNIFSRIFHPAMAHRFLFERDMPMLALPV